MQDCENWVKFGVWLVQCRDLEMSKTKAPPGSVELAARQRRRQCRGDVFFVIKWEWRVRGLVW